MHDRVARPSHAQFLRRPTNSSRLCRGEIGARCSYIADSTPDECGSDFAHSTDIGPRDVGTRHRDSSSYRWIVRLDWQRRSIRRRRGKHSVNCRGGTRSSRVNTRRAAGSQEPCQQTDMESAVSNDCRSISQGASLTCAGVRKLAHLKCFSQRGYRNASTNSGISASTHSKPMNLGVRVCFPS